MNIGFVGYGKLGQPCADRLALTHNVTVYDTRTVYSTNVTVAKSLREVAENSDLVFITIPTPHSEEFDGKTPSSHLAAEDFEYEDVKATIFELDQYMTTWQSIVLVSTVLPGTIREQILPRITRTKFIYNPFLISQGNVANDFVNPDMVIIGVEKESHAEDLLKMYDPVLNPFAKDPFPYKVVTYEEAECLKVFYNTFTSMKIGFVNMIMDVAHRQGNVNTDVITNALTPTLGEKYTKAGMGDGGACHPRDNIAMRLLSEKLDLGYNLFQSLAESREQQAKNLAKDVLLYGNRIMFSSDSYKHGVDMTNGSYSLLVQYYVRELGGEIVDMFPDVVFKVHEQDDIELDLAYAIAEDSVVIYDPWRTHPKYSNPVVYYGDSKNGRI